MKAIIPYLFFNGDCREAMTHYAAVLGGTVRLQDASDAPGAPPARPNVIMHAHLAVGDMVIMASDWMATEPMPQGRSFSLFLDCDNREEQARLFAALGDGGTVTMPLQETFWGAHFGMLIDKFGTRWMLNIESAPAS